MQTPRNVHSLLKTGHVLGHKESLNNSRNSVHNNQEEVRIWDTYLLLELCDIPAFVKQSVQSFQRITQQNIDISLANYKPGYQCQTLLWELPGPTCRYKFEEIFVAKKNRTE